MADIKRIMPEAYIIYRPVWSAHDLTPNMVNQGSPWYTGEDWFNRLIASFPPGADALQFVNEWQGGNDAPADYYRKFNDFYVQLIFACRKRGLICTVGDFSVGTPGLPTIPSEAEELKLLDGMFSTAEANLFPVNVHLYSPEGRGATNMAEDAPDYILRPKIITARHPHIILVGGECGNAAKDTTGREGCYRPETLALQRQFADLIHEIPQLTFGNWWEIVDPALKTGFEKDNWSDVIGQYFAWAATR